MYLIMWIYDSDSGTVYITCYIYIYIYVWDAGIWDHWVYDNVNISV